MCHSSKIGTSAKGCMHSERSQQNDTFDLLKNNLVNVKITESDTKKSRMFGDSSIIIENGGLHVPCWGTECFEERLESHEMKKERRWKHTSTRP